jgi:hypothetical protein
MTTDQLTGAELGGTADRYGIFRQTAGDQLALLCGEMAVNLAAYKEVDIYGPGLPRRQRLEFDIVSRADVRKNLTLFPLDWLRRADIQAELIERVPSLGRDIPVTATSIAVVESEIFLLALRFDDKAKNAINKERKDVWSAIASLLKIDDNQLLPRRSRYDLKFLYSPAEAIPEQTRTEIKSVASAFLPVEFKLIRAGFPGPQSDKRTLGKGVGEAPED